MLSQPTLSPSVMCMDFAHLLSQMEVINTHAHAYHVDIMDGHFVENLALSPLFVAAMRPHTHLPIHCHLMVERPQDYFESLKKSGADLVSFHAESTLGRAFRWVSALRDMDIKAGVVLNPETPLELITPYLPLLSQVTFMTVAPGFASQPFIPAVLEKIEAAAHLKQKKGLHFTIEADGAIGEKTYKALLESGVEQLVLGTAGLFQKDTPLATAFGKLHSTLDTICSASHDQKGGK